MIRWRGGGAAYHDAKILGGAKAWIGGCREARATHAGAFGCSFARHAARFFSDAAFGNKRRDCSRGVCTALSKRQLRNTRAIARRCPVLCKRNGFDSRSSTCEINHLAFCTEPARWICCAGFSWQRPFKGNGATECLVRCRRKPEWCTDSAVRRCFCRRVCKLEQCCRRGKHHVFKPNRLVSLPNPSNVVVDPFAWPPLWWFSCQKEPPPPNMYMYMYMYSVVDECGRVHVEGQDGNTQFNMRWGNKIEPPWRKYTASLEQQVSTRLFRK